MSKINLTTVMWYEVGKGGKPLDPTLSLTGVESRFPSVSFPVTGTTFLYGHRNAGEAYLLKEAHKHGYSASIVHIRVDIGNWLSHKVGFAPDDLERGIENTSFFALVRAKKEVLDAVVDVWAKTVPQGIEDFPKRGTRFANIFDDLVKVEKFKHLKVISYTVSTVEAGEFQVATVFDMSAIDGLTKPHILQDTEILGYETL